MSDTTPPAQASPAAASAPPASVPPSAASTPFTGARPPLPPVVAKRGLGIAGAFVTGLVASAVVLAGALASLPHWPPELRALWRGAPAVTAPPAGNEAVAAATSAAASAFEAAKRDLTARLDDLDKRVRALANTANATPERPAAAPDPAIAELRNRLDSLEKSVSAGAVPTPAAGTAPAPVTPAAAEPDKDLAALRLEIATLRAALQTLDQNVGAQKEETARQRQQAQTLATAVEKATAESGARGAADQQAMAAARASAVIGIAARLSAAFDSGLPFSADLALLAPLTRDDAKLAGLSTALQPFAQAGVASRAALTAEFPAMAKAALADDRADDSFGERLLGKVRSVVSLRRVGADVAGDTAEAKLARAEAALNAGDVAKAAELVKSLPPGTEKARAAWLGRAEAHLAAQRAVDQLAAYAVALLAAAR